MNGAEITIKLLENQGIKQIAGIPGGSNLPLYNALENSTIAHVLARHEQGAGFIAQGIARTSGKPAVCFATSGPGATNILTALADAYLDGVAVVFITGQVPTTLLGKDSFQEVDIIAMAKPVTKRTYFISDVAMLNSVIPEAFSYAAQGKPGPVLIDIPKNIQQTDYKGNIEQIPKIDSIELYSDYTLEIEKIIAMIAEAENPLLYIGGGVAKSGSAAENIIAIAEKTDTPIVATLMGLGTVSSSHPLFLGMSGMHGSAAANLIFNQSDLIIGIGVRFSDRATGRVSDFARKAKIIQINRDGNEDGKIKNADIFITGNTDTIVKQLNEQLPKIERARWLDKIASIKILNPDLRPANNGRIYPCNIIASFGEVAEDDAIITTDVGQHQMWVAQYFPFSGNQRFLTSGGLGTMGFGLPAAIGAALAEPEKQILCFTGDGSFLMNVQELATCAELNSNVKIILLNNNALGLVRQQQELFYGGRLFASQFTLKTEFTKIAEGFGIEALRIRNSELTHTDMKMLLSEHGPQLIEIGIDQEHNVYPMVIPGSANYEMVMK